MNEFEPRDPIERELNSRSELSPVLRAAISSRLVTAIQGCIGLFFFIVFILAARGWEFRDMLPWIFGSWAIMFLLAMGLPHLFHSIAHVLWGVVAIVEAGTEIATQRDLNRSGAIGDVKLIEATATPNVEEKPVPFPPVSFVAFVWDWRNRTGKFPTVDECVGKFGRDNAVNRGMMQEWYGQMVAAGAIVNRIPKQSAGDPAWDQAQFMEAAYRAATTPPAPPR